MKRFLLYPLILIVAAFAGALAADSPAPDQLGASTEPLAVMGEVTLTQGEMDAALSRIPDDKRLLFVRDGGRMEQLVRNLLRSKALAHEAVKAGYDRETLVGLRLQLGRESALAQEWLQKVVADAPEADFEALAEEQYLLTPEVWKSADRIDVSHILISTETRSEEEAKDLVGYLWQQLQLDPSRFDALVEEYSEDPTKETNGGRFTGVKRGEMVTNFENVAFAMTMPGEISAPTETPYGFHIIRLDRKIPGEVPPFESIREQAIEQARLEYRDEYRDKYLRQLLSDDIVLQDGAAEALAKRYFGEDLELAPEFNNIEARDGD